MGWAAPCTACRPEGVQQAETFACTYPMYRTSNFTTTRHHILSPSLPACSGDDSIKPLQALLLLLLLLELGSYERSTQEMVHASNVPRTLYICVCGQTASKAHRWWPHGPLAACGTGWRPALSSQPTAPTHVRTSLQGRCCPCIVNQRAQHNSLPRTCSNSI